MSAVEATVDLVLNPENENAEKLIENLELQRKKVLSAALDPTYAGPIFLLYALKGKLGMLERSLLGAMGVATIIYAFRNNAEIKKLKDSFNV
jgi:hypothetical protein